MSRTLNTSQFRDFETIYNYLHIESVVPDKADAIIVGGSGPRGDMAERAAQLYLGGVAPWIVMSGFSNPNHGVVEAEFMANRAIELGVPRRAIFREGRATNTGLNIKLSASLLKDRGIPCKRIVLVHKPYMTRRFLATAERQWPEPRPKFFITSMGYGFKEYLGLEKQRGLVDDTLAHILSDYVAIKDYPGKGFMIPQPSSTYSESAFNRLVSNGYSTYTPNPKLSTDCFSKL